MGVHATSTVGDGVVEEELLYHFFLLRLWSALITALSSRSQLGVRDQMAAASEAFLFSLKGMACPGDGSKIANTIQLRLVQSKRNNHCIATSSCSYGRPFPWRLLPGDSEWARACWREKPGSNGFTWPRFPLQAWRLSRCTWRLSRCISALLEIFSYRAKQYLL